MDRGSRPDGRLTPAPAAHRHGGRSGRRRGRRAISYSKGRAPAKAFRVAGSRAHL